MKISIIICSDSENEVLKNCLETIKRQSFGDYETLVADTGVYGSREEMVSGILKENFRYFFHEKRKRYHVEADRNRNMAAAMAGGEVLFFLLDSIMLEPGTLEKLSKIFAFGAADVCIPQLKYLRKTKLYPDTDLRRECYTDRFHLSRYDYKVIKNEKLLRTEFPWGKTNLFCYAVRKSAFEACGGYDERTGIYAGSDADLIYRLCRERRSVYFPPDLTAYVQEKERYPVVRWRASGGEYLAYRYPSRETADWFTLKKLEKDITDYNRYHKSGVSLSRRGERKLTEQYGKKRSSHAVVLVIDSELTEEILGEIRRLLKCPYPVYPVSVLPDNSPEMEKLLKVLDPAEREALFCGWKQKEEWETLCELTDAGASEGFLRGEFQEAAGKYREEWIRRREELIGALCDHLDADLSEDTFELVRTGELCRKTELAAPAEAEPSRRTGKTFLKKWKFDFLSWVPEEEGGSLPPRTISFRLTYQCNLHCKMCGQWGDHGIYKGRSAEFIHQYLPLEKLKQIVDETSRTCPGMYYIWGGEPMLHPDYISLIRYIKEKKIFCTTTTNGMFLKKYAREICSIGTEFIRISIDGTEEIHNRIRGNSRCYQTVMEGIREIEKYKKENKSIYPVLECDSVIIPENYLHIEDYIDTISRAKGIHSINFSHPVYAGERVGQEQNRAYQEEFGITAGSWNGFVMDLERVDTDKLISIIERVTKKTYPVPVNFDPPMRTLEDIRAHYTDIERLYKNRYCTVPWIWTEIHPDGRVSFCEDFCDYYIGDLKEAGFAEIWNSEKARAYRKVLLRRNKFPICSYCGLLCHDADY